MALSTINLLWQRKARGAHPVSRFAVADDGTALVSLPDDLAARLYHLTEIGPDGETARRVEFAVETLRKLETAFGSPNCLGMTDHDLYLFREGRKTRFLTERRITILDAALSADGRIFAAITMDMSGASTAAVMGDIEGRPLWALDLDYAATTVAISRDGGRAAVGTEQGMLPLYDSARRLVWEFSLEDAITALACSADGSRVAYGTASGAVGRIDGDGARRWETRLAGVVKTLALSGDGETCVALTQAHEDAPFELTVLVGMGAVGWNLRLDRRITGLALSEDGRKLLLSARDATLSLYELEMSEAETPPDNAPRLARAHALAAAGDAAGACALLREALASDAGDAEACEALLRLRAGAVAAGYAGAEAAFAAEDWPQALARLEALLSIAPDEGRAVAMRASVRERMSRQLRAQAQERAADDPDAALALLAQAVEADPLHVEARREIAALRVQRVAHILAEAEKSLAADDAAGAVAALERARALAPSPEISDKLREAQIAREFAAGMRFYDARKYTEAAFQFKKVLSLDPNHADALRHLNFADKFAQDDSDLSGRFSRLE